MPPSLDWANYGAGGGRRADWTPGPGEVNLGTTSGDPDEVTVSTTDPDKVTVWLGATGATDPTRPDAEELAALLLRAVRQLGG